MFVYGMKSRGFSPGCQPMAGLVERRDDPSGKYYDLLCYTYSLSADDMWQYDLVFVREERICLT